MIKITTTELICLLFEIEQIEAALEYETGFNCYDYFLTDILMMNHAQILDCLTMSHNTQKQKELIHTLIDFISEYFNIEYQYDPASERK